MKTGVIAVVLTYHPDFSVIDNIKAALGQVDSVVVVDNESSEESRALLKNLPLDILERVEFVWNERNEGVAKGFNQGMQKALDLGAPWILLLDQDSQVGKDMVDILLKEHHVLSKDSSLVIVGPYYGRELREVPKTKQTPFLITSGTLLSRAVIERNGFYREDFFIDHVDHEYCLRMKRLGGECYLVQGAILKHRFGTARKVSFLGFEFWMQDYSPMRRYYMMRNRVILYRLYGGFGERWCWVETMAAFKDLVKLLVWESDRGPKIRAVLSGVVDGVTAALI